MTERRLDPLLESRMREQYDYLDIRMEQFLVEHGLLPDSATGKYRQTRLGGIYSDARQVELSTLPSTPGTDITERSNLIFLLGKVLEELDTLMNTVTRLREGLQLDSGNSEGGHRGLDAARTSACPIYKMGHIYGLLGKCECGA